MMHSLVEASVDDVRLTTAHYLRDLMEWETTNNFEDGTLIDVVNLMAYTVFVALRRSEWEKEDLQGHLDLIAELVEDRLEDK